MRQLMLAGVDDIPEVTLYRLLSQFWRVERGEGEFVNGLPEKVWILHPRKEQ